MHRVKERRSSEFSRAHLVPIGEKRWSSRYLSEISKCQE